MGGPVNWTIPPATSFVSGDNVVFDDTATQNLNVQVDAAGVTVNTLAVQSFVNNYSFTGGSITVTAVGGLTKSNSPTVTFNNAVNTPLTTILGGTLIVSPTSVFTSTQITVTGGTLTVNGSAISGNLSVGSAAFLTGLGTITGASGSPTVSIAGTVTPTAASSGGAPGLTFGSAGVNSAVTLSGTYDFSITTLGPTAAANSGGSSSVAVQGLLVVNGPLSLAGSTVSPIASGTGFTGSGNYSWTIATATGGFTGGLPALSITSGDFIGLAASGFSLNEVGNSLLLNYVAPSAWTGQTNGLWSVGTNWFSGATPVSGQTAVFNGAGNGNTTINLGNTVVPIGSILFDTAERSGLHFGLST